MKSLNSFHRIVSVTLFAGMLGLTGCDSPMSSNNTVDEESQIQKEEVVSLTEDPGSKAIEGQYIVILKNDAEGIDASDTANKMAAKSKASVGHVFDKAIKGFTINLPQETAEQDLEALRNDPNVLFVEQDYEVRGAGSQTNATWGLDRSDQRGLPIDGIYNYSATGESVTAYILDSGINYSHVDFGGRASFGFDIYNEGGEDCHGHGTHVAGTVGGSQWGIAKNVDLVSVRVLNCDNSGTISGVIDAIDWITQNANGPSVVNMSLVTSITSSSLDYAIESSIASGITFVIAAGNLDADACSYSPSRVTDAIIVGAANDTDARAYFSNYGSCLDLFAPGTDITSAFIGSDTATKVKNGTSMSTPHVTGAVALYLQSNPDASPSEIESFIISNATQNVVTDSNTDNNHVVYTLFETSSGDDGGSTNTAPSASFSYTADNLAVQFADGSSDSDGSIESWSWDFGDDASSASQNPSHTYSAAGTYSVSLTVTDDAGASDTVTKSITVEEEVTNAAPTAAFSSSVDYLNVQFTDGSSDSDGSIASWSWDFGDGSNSSSQNPSHSYSQAGSYNVSLTVTDNAGATDTVSKTVTVEEQQTTNSDPVIDTFSFKAYKNGPWNKVDVTWAVSDEDGDLATVKTELLEGTYVVASKKNSIQGNAASGVHDLKTRRRNPDSVRITVTDSNGNSTTSTKNLDGSGGSGGDTTSGSFELSATGSKEGGRWVANLSWNGSSASRIDVYRSGSRITRTYNDGSYRDKTRYRGSGSLTYQVCEAGTNTCSEEVTVNF